MDGRLLSVFLILFSIQASASKDVFKIYPYLHFQKGQTIALSWQYKRGEVEHISLPLDGCGFGDKSYQIKGMDQPIKIKNIPCPLTQDLVRLSFIADTQEGTETDRQFSQIIENFDSNAVIYGGDIVQSADKESEWKDLFEATKMTNSHRVMVPVVGNHEYRGDPTAQFWEKYFNFSASDAFYSVWLGPVKLIVINSNFEDDPSEIQKQLGWLDQELAKPAPWKFVVFHQPPYSKSVMHMSFYWRKEYIPLREFYVPLFEKHKVDVVLNGHTHIFEHSFKNGVHYITTGAAGGKPGHGGATNPFELKAVEERTVIQIEANQLALRLAAVTLEGKTIDDLVLEKK